MERLHTMPTIKVLKWSEITTPDDRFDWSREFILTIGGPARTNIRNLKHALSEAFDTFCTHAHDCCGRWYTTVWTHTLHRTKSGEWTVRVSSAANV